MNNTDTLTAPSPLRAYHGQQAIKDKYLTRVCAHRKADEIVQGYGYWSDGKGCAVGCTLHSAQHSSYESELGVPRTLAYLEDRLFERMPKEQARLWPERFLAAIPVGADLSLVWPRWVRAIVLDETTGAARHCKNAVWSEKISQIRTLFDHWIATGVKPAVADFRAARQDLPRYWYYRWAAEAAAAEAAAAAAEAAAAVADRPGVWRKTYDTQILRQADLLLELLAAAPVPAEVAAS